MKVLINRFPGFMGNKLYRVNRRLLNNNAATSAINICKN